MLRTLFLIFCFCIKNYAIAQKNVTHQNLLWYGVFTTVDIHKKWYFQNEFQQRHFVHPLVQHQFLIRSHIHRLLGDSGWEGSVGMCVFWQSPNDPISTNRLTIPELRPHVEFAYVQKLPTVSLDHRYRAEARFFHNTNSTKTELTEGYSFGNYRFRYRLQATMRLLKLSVSKYLKLKVSNELHVNAGRNITKNIFDQNRFFIGFGLDVAKDATVEVGYMNWYQQKSNGSFYDRDILRFTVFHKIKARKK